MLRVRDASVLEEHPLFAAVDLLAARLEITTAEAQSRLEYVAESLGFSCIELAELMLYEEAAAAD